HSRHPAQGGTGTSRRGRRGTRWPASPACGRCTPARPGATIPERSCAPGPACRTLVWSGRRQLTRQYTVPAGARFTLHVSGIARESTSSIHGAQLSANEGLGFIAEQSIYGTGQTTIYGTAGLAQ